MPADDGAPVTASSGVAAEVRAPKAAQGGEAVGYAVVNDAPVGDVATVAVTGLGRSGTTMIARVLRALDVPMPGETTPQTCEDAAMVSLLRAGDLEGAERLVAARNAASRVWAFKAPVLRGHLAWAERTLRAPRFVLTWRDPLAIAQRNQLALDADLSDSLRLAGKGLAVMAKDASVLRAPTLLVSYEKAVMRPDRLVDALSAFLGLSPSDEALARAAAEIRPGDPRYMGATA